MYRNVYYTVDESWQGKIHLSTWDIDGKPIEIDYDHNSFLYMRDSAGEFNSIYGEKCSKKEFKNIYQRKKFIDDHPNFQYYNVQRPEQEFLSNMFIHEYTKLDFNQFPLRIHYIDIEIQIQDEFPNADEAKYPINVITIYDSYLKKYMTWILDGDYTPNKDNIEVRKFTNESRLLDDFIIWISNNRPDVITGYNSMGFDIPYIINRGKQLIPNKISMISPANSYFRNKRSKADKRNQCEYTIVGMPHIDYFFLYKYKYGFQQYNYKLDTLGREELGVSKIEYEGSMKEFYQNDFSKFVDYNIRDVELLVLLEKKLKLIELSRIICNFGLCPIDGIYSSNPYISNAVMLFQNKDKYYCFPTTQKDMSEIKGSYAGAYVKQPKIGIYKKGMATFDIKSLYPNTMRALNISPETKFGRVVERNNGLVMIKTGNGNIKPLSNDKFNMLLKTKCNLSSADVLFYKEEIKSGIMPKFITWLYTKRVGAQQLASKYRKEGRKQDAEYQELISWSFKIVLNSLYGVTGNKYSQFFDRDIAESITLSGQHIIKNSEQYLNTIIRKKYNVKTDSVVYIDTDSNFFTIDYLTEKYLNGDPITVDNVDIIAKHTDNLVEILNRVVFQKIVKQDFYSNGDYIKFEREKICRVTALFTKKQYVLYPILDGDKIVDDFKYTGGNLKKYNYTKEVKSSLKYIVEDSLLNEWDNNRFQLEISKIWDVFKKSDIDKIAEYRGYSTEKTAVGFQTEKRTGAHAKAAIFYNELINRLGIDNIYEKIVVGDKIRMTYVKPTNKFRISIIGYLDKYPTEFYDVFEIDYEKMFQNLILKTIENYCNLNGWIRFNPIIQYQANILNL